MSLRLQRSIWFIGDLEHYAAWYDREAGWQIADNYLRAVESTLRRLAQIPGLGHVTVFNASELARLRCLRVEAPFQKHLIFYRFDQTTVYAERVVHGSRDLNRRLKQPPNPADD